jgi:hypothetical protein
MFADVMPLLSDRSAGYVRTAHSPSVPVTGADGASYAVAAARAVAAGADAAGAVEAADSVLPVRAGGGEEAPAQAPAAPAASVASVASVAATSQDAFLTAPAAAEGPVAVSVDFAAESVASPHPLTALSAPVPAPPVDLPDAPQHSAPGPADGRSPVPVPSRQRRGRKLIMAVAAVAIAVVIGGGAAALLLRHPAASAPPPGPALPSGWSTETVRPSVTGTAAGFTIGVPPGWRVTRQKLAIYITAPGGKQYLEVDLTRHAYNNMVKEAQYIQEQVLSKGSLPGYQRLSIRVVPIHGTTGASWDFTWMNLNNGPMRVNDQLFIESTKNGRQSYAIYYTAPIGVWSSAVKDDFDTMLKTFEPVSS